MSSITHTSRTGNTYYLHTGPKRGGGIQHFFSTQSAGTLAERLPEGFEIHESVNGKVWLRRQRPKLLRDDEHDCIAMGVKNSRAGHRYKIEVEGKILTVHESATRLGVLEGFALLRSQREIEAIEEKFAHYQPILRFILVHPEKRLFAPERYCFRGSVDDWISIGPPESIEKLALKYLKHLGQESMYDPC